MIEQIAHLLEHETAGDPIKGLKWRRRATRKIAQHLRRLKIQVSASTVRRLLKQMGYSLRVNHKKLESGNKNLPPRRVRHQQFGYIERQRKQFLAQGNPIISIDAKKKEMIGNFKSSGAGWERQPQLVMDHDFRSDAKGMAVPYGIYDPVRNQGFVVVGPAMRPRRLPSMPSRCGGRVTDRGCTARPRGCSSWPTRAAATALVRVAGPTTCNRSS